MKTTPFARWIIKVRFTAICVAVAALVAIELGVGGSMASRIGQATAIRTEVPQAPNVSLADFMAAVR
jgi:hypothetical protein